MLNKLGLDKNRYNRASEHMLGQNTVFYFEGLLDKNFYKNFQEINRFTLLQGGSCSKVIEKVSSRKNHYGIIDNDYKERSSCQIDRIFRINYYSIENIVLCEHSLFDNLRSLFETFLSDISHIDGMYLNIIPILERDENKRVTGFNVDFGEAIHDQYHEYVKVNITNIETFFRYFNVKRIVVKYGEFLNQTGIRISKNPLLDLHDKYKEKSVKAIFDTEEFIRFSNYDLYKH